MHEFKKGQIVVVNSPEEDDRQWHLRIYESKIARDIHKTYNPDKEDYDTWSLCFPAEEVWPNIFLGRERDAGEQSDHAVEVQRLRRQIEWLCRQIQSLADIEWGNVCPPVGMSPYYIDCQCNCIACWEQASLKAVTKEESDE